MKTHLKVIIWIEGSYQYKRCDVFKILKQIEVDCLLLKSPHRFAIQSFTLKERVEGPRTRQ